MIEATHIDEREQRRSRQQLFLDWVQLPVASATIAATFSHLVLRWIEPFHILGNVDLISTIAAVLTLGAVLAYRLGHPTRTF